MDERNWFYTVADKRVRGPISESQLYSFQQRPTVEQPLYVWKEGGKDKISYQNFLRTYKQDHPTHELDDVFIKARTSNSSKLPQTSWMGTRTIPSVDSETGVYGFITLLIIFSILSFLGYGIYEGYETQERKLQQQALIEEKAEERRTKQRLQQDLLAERDEYLGTTFVTIPGSKFGRIGCDWAVCQKNELPYITVKFDEYQIQATEVTLKQWDMCVNDGGCKEPKMPVVSERDTTPVTGVSHFEISTEFLPWLNSKGFGHYRLPTEVEWETAAKAGNNRDPFHWGRIFDFDKALIYTDKQKAEFKKSGVFPLSIKLHEPNSFGLFDMHGSVSEWTTDCSTRSYSSYSQLRTNNRPIAYKDCQGITVRGSSWYDDPKELTVFTRRFYRHDLQTKVVGFRLVMDKLP